VSRKTGLLSALYFCQVVFVFLLYLLSALVLCGVRQGAVLSPYLFAVYIDSVFTRVKSCPLGCTIKWHCVSIFIFADDIVLLAPSISALQDLLHICEAELAWLDMSLIVNP